MKFAFSSVAGPSWDFPTLAAKAREFGFDGVEIRGYQGETALTASDPFVTDPQKLRQLFQDSCLSIAALSSGIAMSTSRAVKAQQADLLKRYIDTAANLGCPQVKLLDTQVPPGRPLVQSGIELGDWLAPLGDYAAECKVTLLIQNALSFRAARDLWLILEQLNTPAIAVAWDVYAAASVGESPIVSVPVLASRLQYAIVKDGQFTDTAATVCPPGEGQVQIQKFLVRLRGIGFAGYVSVDWDKTRLPKLPDAEQVLPAALKKMRQWITPPVVEKKPAPEAKKPVPAK